MCAHVAELVNGIDLEGREGESTEARRLRARGQIVEAHSQSEVTRHFLL